ncbi:11210_t:CDS:2 [Ambispora leptoticha]|uniref:11210_t:CDS:1 n=1 Tax=Ambispora leptoticha TaxID=144679 RepID=A0A9N9DUC6_9GLOM|nr:11210_t:CDS:2 [Ambispora leptoticha]
MKVYTALALLMAVISLTADAAPTSKQSIFKVDLKKNDLPEYFTWLQKSLIEKNRAILKYSDNIRLAYDHGLVGQEAIVKLDAATTPVFGKGKHGKGSNGSKNGGKNNNNPDNGQPDNSGNPDNGQPDNSNNPNNGQPDNSGNQPDNSGKGIVNNPLKDQGMDIGYHGPVQIGGQTFDVIFDTGSADLWIPAQACNDAACKAHKSFDPKKSKGFTTDNKPFQIRYGTGEVSGVIAKDDISIAGAVAKGQTFGLSTKMSQDFQDTEFDGILGMGLDQLSSQKAKTPFSDLVTQNAVKDSVFGFFLGRQKDGSNSQLTLGGIDSSKFTGQLKYNKLVSNVGYWEIALDDASVNGKPLGFNKKTAIIDTGTTLLIAPPADADAIHKEIKGAVSQQGEYFVPCNTDAVVALTFGGVTYKISPKDLAREPTKQNNMCLSGIAGGNIGGADQWLVGDTFLKNVYSAYDIKKLAVGFAPVK